VDNNQQAWTLMKYLVEKILDDDKDIKSVDKPQFKLTDPIASFLGCIYVNNSQRLSIKQAVLIREHLHLETLKDLLDVTYDDLVGIKGIGSKTAKAVIDVIK
jgi:DNA integrity scanning protein DisA with diadenylate cyclase activity